MAGFEVVAGDEAVVLARQGDGAGDEGVLRGAVDEGGGFEGAGDGEDGAGTYLGVLVLDGGHEVGGGVVDAGDDVGVAFGVGGPEDDYFVERVRAFEGSEEDLDW